MRLALILALAGFALARSVAPAPALAQSADLSTRCALIRDQDLRAACRAGTSGRSSACAIIRDGDLRALCRARSR